MTVDDWYVFHFRLAPGFTHEDALDVLSRVEGHPAVGAWGFGDADAPGDERAALRRISRDMHRTSRRPCATCREITEALGEPFGCVAFHQRQRKNDERVADGTYGQSRPPQ